MSFIPDSTSSFTNKNFQEKIQEKKSQLNISDSLVKKKVIFAFFLDRFHPKTEEEALAYHSLTDFEWCPGSLAADGLKNLLSNFLDSKHSKSLSSEARSQLIHFISLLDNAKEHYAEIDYILSKDATLSFFAGGASPLVLAIPFKRTLNEEDLQQAIDHCLARIKTLKPGEKVLFQGGTQIHVAPFTIEYTGDKYIAKIYNTTSIQERVFIVEESLNNFFNEMVSHKLDPKKRFEIQNLPIFPNMPKGRKGKPIRKDQLANTCHTKGLLTMLCDSLKASDNQQPKDQVDTSWSDFKSAFGDFLLDEEIENESLLHKLSAIEQESRKARTSLYHSTNEALSSSDEEEQIHQEYEQLINEQIEKLRGQRQNPSFLEDEAKAKATTIVEQQKKLKKIFKLLPSAEIEKIATERKLHPVVREHLEILTKKQKTLEETALLQADHLIERINDENSNEYASIGLIGNFCQKAFIKLASYFKVPSELINPSVRKPEYRSLPTEKLKGYLLELKESSKVSDEHIFEDVAVNMLKQALEEGFHEDFFEIYENLSKGGKETLKAKLKALNASASGQLLDKETLKKIKAEGLDYFFGTAIQNSFLNMLSREDCNPKMIKEWIDLIDFERLRINDICKEIGKLEISMNPEELFNQNTTDLDSSIRIIYGALIANIYLSKNELLPFILECYNRYRQSFEVQALRDLLPVKDFNFEKTFDQILSAEKSFEATEALGLIFSALNSIERISDFLSVIKKWKNKELLSQLIIFLECDPPLISSSDILLAKKIVLDFCKENEHLLEEKAKENLTNF